MGGRAAGKTFALRQDVATIGRAEGNDVVVDDVPVSGRHARLVRGLDRVTIEDLGSTNGTFILRGDDRVVVPRGGEGVSLNAGDVVQLGEDRDACRLAIRRLDEDDVTTATVVTVKSVDERTEVPHDVGRLGALYAAQREIGRAEDLDAVLHAIADAAFDLLAHATHVTVVLQARDEGAGPKAHPSSSSPYLPVLTRRRPEDKGGPPAEANDEFIPITRSVYRQVIRERSAVLAADAKRQLDATPSLMGASVRSTIAIPLWRGDEILGVLQVDNRDAPGMLKPVDLDVLLLIAEPASLAVANARLIGRLRSAEERARSEADFLKHRDKARRAGGRAEGREVSILGDSDPMQALMRQLDKVVDTNVSVLIEGETGTGKELVASALHYRSRRRDEIFVAQNCAALAETLLESELFGHRKGSFTGAHEDKKGLFELADGSTLFLDEITEAPMAIQSKLLRALQEGEVRPVGAPSPRRVDVRVVAATNRNLEREVEAGRFREDLYYRLKVFPLRVPPLRERRADIPLLASHFLSRFAEEIGKSVAGIAAEVMQTLMAYDWPGNVRELQNEVQRLVIQVDEGAFVTPDLVSPRMRKGEAVLRRAKATRGGTLKETMLAVEKFIVFEALREHDNNKTSTAKTLGITREGLHKKLRQYGSS
ncbi:MAG: sigma 54-interacting transcriptional regulator [Myxococcota bacterium]